MLVGHGLAHFCIAFSARAKFQLLLIVPVIHLTNVFEHEVCYYACSDQTDVQTYAAHFQSYMAPWIRTPNRQPILFLFLFLFFLLLLLLLLLLLEQHLAQHALEKVFVPNHVKPSLAEDAANADADAGEPGGYSVFWNNCNRNAGGYLQSKLDCTLKAAYFGSCR